MRCSSCSCSCHLHAIMFMLQYSTLKAEPRGTGGERCASGWTCSTAPSYSMSSSEAGSSKRDVEVVDDVQLLVHKIMTLDGS